MNRFIPIISALFILILAGCSGKFKGDCMHCDGCFNSWTECRSDWNDPNTTWEEHRDQKIAESQYSTDHCYLVEE